MKTSPLLSESARTGTSKARTVFLVLRTWNKRGLYSSGFTWRNPDAMPPSLRPSRVSTPPPRSLLPHCVNKNQHVLDALEVGLEESRFVALHLPMLNRAYQHTKKNHRRRVVVSSTHSAPQKTAHTNTPSSNKSSSSTVL